MRIERVPDLTAQQKEIITRLWNAEYPESLKYESVEGFEAFLNKQTNRLHFLLFDETDEIRGWLMTFTRESERWFSVIVDGKCQKKGFGTALLNEIKSRETNINGWVVAHDGYFKSGGEKYLSPLGFYRKNGFTLLQNETLENSGLDAMKINWTR